MIVTALFALLAQGGTAPAPADPGPLPALFQRDELTRCGIQTVNDTYGCLLRALGEDQAREIFLTAGNTRYIAAIEQAVREEWRLDDANSPLSRDLAKRGVYSKPQAAQIVLADFQARLNAKRFDYARLAKTMKEQAAAAPKPAAIMPGPLPLERCKSPADAPGVVIVSCVQNADGTIAIGRRTPVKVTPGPLPFERCMRPEFPPGTKITSCEQNADGSLSIGRTEPSKPKSK